MANTPQAVTEEDVQNAAKLKAEGNAAFKAKDFPASGTL